MTKPALDPRPEQPAIPRCTTCGGEDVVRDAWAAWDAVSGRWDLAALFDAAWCRDCDRPTTIDRIAGSAEHTEEDG